MSASAIDRYNAHDFESDETWKSYRNNLNFTQSDDVINSRLMEKFKRKYYHSRVEPLPESFLSSTTTTTSSSSGSSSTSTSSTSGNSSGATVSGGTLFDVQLLKLLFLTREGHMVLIHLLAIAMSMLGFIGVTSGLYKTTQILRICYSQSIIVFIYLNGVLFFARHPGLSFKTIISSLTRETEGQYIILGILYLTGGSASSVFMFLLLILSLCLLARRVVKEFVPKCVNSVDQALGAKVLSLISIISERQTYQNMIIIAARFELFLFLSEVIMLFSSSREILRTMFLGNYLVSRYMVSPAVRRAFSEFKSVLDAIFLHRLSPVVISNFYRKANQTISTYIDEVARRVNAAANPTN